MTRMFDARVPVAFGLAADAQPGDATLLDQQFATAGHVPGCACCVMRTPAAEALGQLFQRRARGEVAFFGRVLVVSNAAGQDAIKRALESDPVVSARFRLA